MTDKLLDLNLCLHCESTRKVGYKIVYYQCYKCKGTFCVHNIVTPKEDTMKLQKGYYCKECIYD